MMEHLSQIEIHMYLDRSLSGEQVRRADHHCSQCAVCAREIAIAKKIDAGLRNLPLDTPSPDFTARVMRQLGIPEAPPLFWSLMRNLAPLLAMGGVVGIVYVVFAAGGLLDPRPDGSAPILDPRPVADAVVSWISVLNHLVNTYVSFLGSNTALGIFLLALVSFIACADKFLIAPLFRKRSLKS